MDEILSIKIQPKSMNMSKHTLLRCFILLVCAAALASLSSCRTARGFGQDVESLGRKIQKAS